MSTGTSLVIVIFSSLRLETSIQIILQEKYVNDTISLRKISSHDCVRWQIEIGSL